jgi:TonB-dependent SusC/RagA subfamily outer membrane receptor
VPSGTREIEAVRSGYRPYRLPLVKIGDADTAHVYLALSAIPEERMANGQLSVQRIADPDRRVLTLTGDTIMISGTNEARAGSITVLGATTTSIGEISANAPLYMIDGIMLAPGTKVSELDPKTIESIEVIKGAAAESMYGTRGANGVIKITTRRPPK